MPKLISGRAAAIVSSSLLFLACANESDGTSTGADTTGLGGYEGLGQYTGVAGMYGNGLVTTGGTLGAGGSGIAPVGTTIALGGSADAGGSSATSQGGASATSQGGASSGGATVTIWPGNYNPSGTALDATGRHSPGVNCMTSNCHGPSQTSRAFAFGGTVYQSGGTTPAAHVQVAIVSGGAVYTTYSATNGNFWLPLANATNINWTGAKVYLRNANGEVAKAATTGVNSGCNSCHGSAMRIVGP